MDAKGWTKLKAIFDEALALPSEEREAFLQEAADDEGMREEIRQLIASYESDPEFLESPVSDGALEAVAEAMRQADAGAEVGAYRLIELIGDGGMGAVYRASRIDGQYEQDVAIKLVRAGMGHRHLIERFRQERQILASLQHPHIARLLDGGVAADGRPYLVMEFVDGKPIDAYCQQQKIATRDRLSLFLTVCEAVQYAHQQLIVHRDLKPSNVLVTRKGHVKLLDFGIAKLIDPESADQPALTRTGVRPMTPEYASPEQIRGESISAASDVYALGVTLYELLTDQRPYDLRELTPSQVEHKVCEEDPPRPSTVIGVDRKRKALRGDLDNIVMKALSKEPGRRYGSVAALAQDIQRHLNQVPVSARRPSWSYRVNRFVRRNRVLVLSGLLLFVALAAGIVSTLQQAKVAADERDRAERRFEDVRQLANTMLFDLHDAIQELPGATPARRVLVANAQEYLARIHEEERDDPSLQAELAEAYTRLGEIQGDPHFPNIGNMQAARESYEEALSLREQIWLRDTTQAFARHELAKSYGRLAVVNSWGGDNAVAIEQSQKALALMAELDEDNPTLPGLGQDRARIATELGWWYVWAGRMEEGIAIIRPAKDELRSLAQAHPDDVGVWMDHWRAQNNEVDGLTFMQRFDEALIILENRACPTLDSLYRAHPLHPRLIGSLRTCHNKIGGLYQHLGNHEKALAGYNQSLTLAREQVRLDSTNIIGYRGVATTFESIGDLLKEQGEVDEALLAFQEALNFKEALFNVDRTNAEAGNMLANTRLSLCKAWIDQGRLDDARHYCEGAIELLEGFYEHDPQNAVAAERLAVTYVTAARLEQRSLANAPPSQRAALRERAIHYYEEGLRMYRTMEQGDVAFQWEIHRDSAKAEIDRLKANDR